MKIHVEKIAIVKMSAYRGQLDKCSQIMSLNEFTVGAFLIEGKTMHMFILVFPANLFEVIITFPSLLLIFPSDVNDMWMPMLVSLFSC